MRFFTYILRVFFWGESSQETSGKAEDRIKVPDAWEQQKEAIQKAKALSKEQPDRCFYVEKRIKGKLDRDDP